MVGGRILHFVFKIPERKQTLKFYRDILGMKVLRHEEFTEGCEAACNGPYANRWSKTMVGYGPENSHFAIELTYNYGVKEYELGNDFQGITICSKDIIERAKSHNWPVKEENGKHILEAPGGYKFFIVSQEKAKNEDPVEKVALSSSDLKRSIAFWKDTLEMTLLEEKGKIALLKYKDNKTSLELQDIGTAVNHAKAYGRVAFAVPEAELEYIRKKIVDTKNTILKDLVRLDTPGKATVTVIILADPDGHEICFVGSEAFDELSQFDPKGEALLERYIEKEANKTL
ncbi:hypothetical protein QAD02_018613 [Eretmocerus hayati]|uniref:Uncharacterized protein n=1 Tax=Eretmocerus hayati TaxID=131215 RepID=A0ACC2PH96_9HYME|nr:hypothetical protein QAD02_018613 [Eretmocerus hayati]